MGSFQFIICILLETDTHFVNAFRLPKRKSQSQCPRLSIEVLHWLASTMRFLPNRTLPISSSFEPIVVADNKKCSILVQLVSYNCVCLAFFSQTECSVMVLVYCRGQLVNILLLPFNFFSSVWFNCFACVWFNCFSRVWFNWFARTYTLILLNFFKRDLTIFLTIFLHPTLFTFWGYTITMNDNFCNILKFKVF